MSGEASISVQTAIYSALTGDATLTGKVTGVYDSVPDETSFPYVAIGDDTVRDFSTNTFSGEEMTLTIHIWSRDRGRKNTKSIMADIYRVLHKANLSLTNGASLIHVLFEFAEIVLDPDGTTYHGIQRFRMLLQEG
jgi:hypothetical protein